MLTVQFISEPPHTNWGVEVSYSVSQRPVAVWYTLAKLGWTTASDDQPIDIERRSIRLWKQYDTTWSDAERKANVLAVRRAMEPFGIHNISHKKLR